VNDSFESGGGDYNKKTVGTGRQIRQSTDRITRRTRSGTEIVIGRSAMSPGRSYLRFSKSAHVINACFAHAPETLRDVKTVA